MTSALVISDDSGAVRLPTMNRPVARNALSPDPIAALYTGLELAAQIAEVPAPIMAGLKEIYVTGAAARADPALAAEQAIAGAQMLDHDGLKDRYAEISERNRRQIRAQPDASSGL